MSNLKCQICGKEVEKKNIIHIFDDRKPSGIDVLVCPSCWEEIFEFIEKERVKIR